MLYYKAQERSFLNTKYNPIGVSPLFFPTLLPLRLYPMYLFSRRMYSQMCVLPFFFPSLFYAFLISYATVHKTTNNFINDVFRDRNRKSFSIILINMLFPFRKATSSLSFSFLLSGGKFFSPSYRSFMKRSNISMEERHTILLLLFMCLIKI